MAEVGPWGLGHDVVPQMPGQSPLGLAHVPRKGNIESWDSALRTGSPSASFLCPLVQTLVVDSYQGSGEWVALEKGTVQGTWGVNKVWRGLYKDDPETEY